MIGPPDPWGEARHRKWHVGLESQIPGSSSDAVMQLQEHNMLAADPRHRPSHSKEVIVQERCKP